MQLAYIGLLLSGVFALAVPSAHAAPKSPAHQGKLGAPAKLSTGPSLSPAAVQIDAKLPPKGPRPVARTGSTTRPSVAIGALAKKPKPVKASPKQPTPVLKEGDTKVRRRIIRIWGRGCFMAANQGSWECYGSVDNWESKAKAELKAKSLADEAAKEVLLMHPGSVIDRKIEVKRTDNGNWDAEVTLQIAVANQLALL